MDYKEWSSLKVGDRVKGYNGEGTIISAVGVGYVVQYDNGIKEKVTNGSLRKLESK